MSDEFEPIRYEPPPREPDALGRHPSEVELQRKRKGMPWWGWLLVSLGVLFGLCCVGSIGMLVWVGSGPDTSVYPGSSLPSAFRDSAEDLGLVDSGETIRYFYSDALVDVENGFVLVTDDHVAVHQPAVGMSRVIKFDEIDAATLSRNTSFFIDSNISLELSDGSRIDFLVSSEYDRDERFYEAIKPSGPGAGGGGSGGSSGSSGGP